MANSVIAEARKGIAESKGNVDRIDKNRFMGSLVTNLLAYAAGGGEAAGASAGTFDKNVDNYYKQQLDQLNNYTQQLNEERRFQEQMSFEADKMKANYQFESASLIAKQENIPLNQAIARVGGAEDDMLISQALASKDLTKSKKQLDALKEKGVITGDQYTMAVASVSGESTAKKLLKGEQRREAFVNIGQHFLPKEYRTNAPSIIAGQRQAVQKASEMYTSAKGARVSAADTAKETGKSALKRNTSRFLPTYQ